MSRPKNAQKEPVKKLCVRLSLSKERSSDVKEMARRDCLLTTSGFQEHPKKGKAKRYLAVEREGSLTVNPPSTDYLSQIRPQSSFLEPTQPEIGSSGAHHRRSSSCRRCEHRQPIEKDFLKNGNRKAFDPVDSKGMYHYPKRMQTGPGECNPTASNSNEMARVKEWINQWCHMYDKKEDETAEEYHRHKHKVHHRHHRACQPADNCEVSCGLRRCPQYLDLATDHLTYPYHTENGFASASPRPQRYHKHSEHHCKRNCCRDSGTYHHDGQPVIHRHEHHHHHSHHHYHHYVS